MVEEHKSQPFHRNGIILEGSFERSFMYHAVNEGFATLIGKPDEITNQIMSGYRRAQKRNQVLDLCLIYDQIHLYAFHDSFNMGCLYDEGLIAHIDPVDPATYMLQRKLQELDPYLAENDIQTCMLLKPIVLPYLRRKNELLTSASYDKMIELMASEEFRLAAFEDRITPSLAKRLLSISHLGEDLGKVDLVLGSATPQLRERVIKTVRENIAVVFFSVLALYDDLITILDLLKHSAETSLPIATPLLRTPSPSSSPTHGIPTEASLEDYYRVFEIVVREVEYFPVANTLDKVIKLRKDNRIVDFRENLTLWATALRENDVDEERKLRGEIRKSNKALQRIKPLKKAGAFLTYIALPLSIIPVLGIPLTVLSIGVQLYADYVEWRNRWLMIGH